MKENKTQPTEQAVELFLQNIADDKMRDACYTIASLMESIAQEAPIMWGASIVGFGKYHYQYASGRQGDWFKIGFAPRKKQLTLYISSGFEPYTQLLEKLGKYTTGKSCLYVNKLEDIDMDVLKEMLTSAMAS